ncbi:23S rRNA (guanine745-N1)-methyltransferase [Clostridiales Family XIII bacterium PM5-7]
MDKVDKFYGIKNLMQCPICAKKIRFHQGGYVCKREHRFDISSKGYVNFLQSNKPLKGYDRDFFQSRRDFFADGFYDHLLQTMVQYIEKTRPKTILDAGCGEGFYAHALSHITDGEIIAFDLALDAIKIAARGENNVKWLVADITNIPIKDKSIECILDVFTTANYGEFKRILADDGVLMKIIPGPHHLHELRETAKAWIHNKHYSNKDVIDYFSTQFHLTEQMVVSKTLPINEKQSALLANMTPLLFDVDKTKLDLSAMKEITIEAEVLFGRLKK